MNENERSLYPLRFEPQVTDTGWGKETLLIGDLGFAESVAVNGWLEASSLEDILETYLERVVGDNVYSYYGRQFPLMVKKLSVTGRMPVTVCPDDRTAEERYDTLGKFKLWYVLDAEPGSRLEMGFSRELTAVELYERCQSGSLEEVLNHITPVKGDVYLIPPGLVHSASDGVTLLEITESSDLDFRIYGSDQPAAVGFTPEYEGIKNNISTDVEELSLEAAFDFINMGEYDSSLKLREKGQYRGQSAEKRAITERLCSRDEIDVTRINLSDPLNIGNDMFDGFIVYVTVKGQLSLQVKLRDGSLEEYVLGAGEAILVPADVQEYYLVPRTSGTVLLEAVTRRPETEDAYIDPEAEATLPGEDYDRTILN
ncbi:MAG: class I mannose-6-phosphate isomerase [Candidatus Cryptobacteroides sp.]